MSHYGAAKAGVINLTSTLAFEWAGDDVRVTTYRAGRSCRDRSFLPGGDPTRNHV